MPGKDGTGPLGKGCGTGKGMGKGRGKLSGSNQFPGRGLGIGNRGNFNNVDNSNLEAKNEALKSELDELKRKEKEV